jgi:ribosomal protein S18 acetylase RimI-like enzyme
MEMAWESESLRLDPLALRRGVEHILANPTQGQYYLVERQDSPSKLFVLGAILIQYEWSDWRGRMIWWIHSLYLRPDYRGLGLYKRVYRWLEMQARERPEIGGMRLYVARENAHAARIYQSLGMTDQHYHLYEWLK